MNCPICSAKEARFRFRTFHPNLPKSISYKIYKCSNCSFMFAAGQVSNEILQQVYGNQFFGSSQQSGVDFGSNKKDMPILINARERLAKILSFKNHGALLDIGAGKGYFVKVAREHFNAEGIELSLAASEYAKHNRVPIISGDFIEYDFGSKKYDVITLWDSVSSFIDPKPLFEKVYNLLNDDGVVIFTVPDESALISKILGRFWPLIVPPINLGYYNKKSIEFLLGDAFIIQKSFHASKKISVKFLFNKLIRALSLNKLNINLAFPDHISMRVQTFDILTIIAAKNSIKT